MDFKGSLPVHKSPYPEASNFSLLIPISKIHFNVILPSVPRCSKWYLFFSCPYQIPFSFYL